MAVSIRRASSHGEIVQCYPVLAELRPHIQAEDFVAIVQRLSNNIGFRLVYLLDDEVKAVAGYRVSEWLHSGKYLEIEDFVTSSGERSKGYGAQLFKWLVAQARHEGCSQLRLVSGVQRTDAHRFYVRQGMVNEAKYFSLNLQ
ncbi:MAG TPA: GNAT family N-acetyltransferase [Xanthomonadaceae bacterium]|jgi:GNAT superfamily N-acetyltransferase|nr:GNAT family N-acetyltransferase [Xanthomonadaceae bacterium]